MKKLPLFLFAAFAFFPIFDASAQMFYNSKSNFDKTGATSYSAKSKKPVEEEADPNREEMLFERIVAQQIRERIRSDAAYIVGEPDETICYGISRKSPKKRTATIDGYAHTGNCGTLNETGMTEIQDKLFNSESYEMNVMKIASCVINPKLALRFRKGFDFVDVILSGGACPAVVFLYGGETREFSAKPIKEWLDNFIEAVSNDLEPLNPESTEKAAANMFRKRTPEEEAAPVEKPQSKPAPKTWGRRVVRPDEEQLNMLPE